MTQAISILPRWVITLGYPSINPKALQITFYQQDVNFVDAVADNSTKDRLQKFQDLLKEQLGLVATQNTQVSAPNKKELATDFTLTPVISVEDSSARIEQALQKHQDKEELGALSSQLREVNIYLANAIRAINALHQLKVSKKSLETAEPKITALQDSLKDCITRLDALTPTSSHSTAPAEVDSFVEKEPLQQILTTDAELGQKAAQRFDEAGYDHNFGRH